MVYLHYISCLRYTILVGNARITFFITILIFVTIIVIVVSVVVIMIVITMRAERPGLKAREKVEELQTTYVDTLQSYESAKRRKGGSALAKFLTRLTDLRSISLEHSSLLLDLQNVGSTLPTLMKEVFILPPEGS